MKNIFFVSLFSFITLSSGYAVAGEYFKQSWFEYPDPSTAPKITARCVKEGSAHVPCPTWREPFRMCLKSTCIGYAYDTELLRVTPTFVVSGPDSLDAAVRRAVEGFAAACALKAIGSGKAAAAATPSPEPTARVAAALAAAEVSFEACIATVSASSAAAAVLNELEFRIDTPTHWARL